MIKSLILSFLKKNNLEIKKINSLPNLVEIDDDDKLLLNKILKSNLSMTSPERLTATLLATKYVCKSKIDGDIVECGVWRGGNSITALHALNKYKSNKSIWMYDTFSGMTMPTKYDIENETGKLAFNEYMANEAEDHNNWCYASIEDVEKNIRPYKKNIKVNFVKGDIVETLKYEKNLPKDISVLRLDTDWYESTKIELEILFPRVQKGGVILIDDYGHWGGCKKAVDEYFSNFETKIFLMPSDYTGRIAIKL